MSRLKKTPLKTESVKHRKSRAEYEKVRKRYLTDHPLCEWCSTFPLPDETVPASVHVHHVVLRSKSKCLQADPRNFCALCEICHGAVHGGAMHDFLLWFKYARLNDFDFLYEREPSSFVKYGVEP